MIAHSTTTLAHFQEDEREKSRVPTQYRKEELWKGRRNQVSDG
jgi:hypothetical protein